MMTMGLNNRILALDVLRGLTIVGMIVFNTSSGFHYEPLNHANWIGLTLADMAFPLFMFIMGITTYLSLSKYGFSANRQTLRKIVVRTLAIVVVCWVFDWLGSVLFTLFGGGDGFSSAGLGLALEQFDHLRYTGVLVRLGLCYGVCAFVSLWVRPQRFPLIIILLLLTYWIVLLLGHGFERTPDNILGIVDRALVGENHMCNDAGIDPEGILSTIPSIAHVMTGFWVGFLIFCRHTVSGVRQKVFRLLLVGAALLICGYFISFFCPLSKKIWSPSFVCVTCGYGCLLLGLLMYVLDVRHFKWDCGMRVIGANPLFVYLLSEAVLWPLHLIKVGCGDEQMDVWSFVFWRGLEPVFGAPLADLVFALINVAFCWLVAFGLYRKKIFIKL